MSTPVLKALAVVTCVTLRASLASAHPLGNASTNHFVGFRIDANEIAIHYVVDMAEIAAFQEVVAATDGASSSLSEHDREAYLQRTTARYLDGLRLTIDGVRVALRVVDAAVETPAGVGGRPTLRVTSDLSGPIGHDIREPSRFAFEDTNHPGRAGWHEIVVSAGPGVAVFDSTAFGTGVSDELRHYPGDPLSAPLQERAAQWSAIAGPLPVGARPQARRIGPQPDTVAPHARLRDALVPPALSTAGACWSVLIAFVLGSLQALAFPKAGDPRDGSRGRTSAILLSSLRAAVAEMSALIPLAVVTLITAAYVLPARWHPVAGTIAGILVGVLGLRLLGAHAGDGSGFGGSIGIGSRSAALLIPLAAIAVHHVGFGSILLAAFGAGLVVAPTATATAECCGTPTVARRAARAHAWIVIGVGLAICAGAMDVFRAIGH